MTVKKIINPLTDRPIIIGGPTYNKLLINGVKLPKKYQFAKKPSRQYSDIVNTNLKEILDMPVKYPILKKGRGVKTKGWGKIAPKRGRERTNLLNKCGKKCFLKSDTLSFPICPKDECALDCRGLNAAYIRASQWKYHTIRESANNIRVKKCR